MTESGTVQDFIALADFEAPAMPTQEVLRRAVGQVLALVGRKDAKPFIAEDRLKKTTLERLDDVVAPPACGPLLDELGRTIDRWLREGTRVSHVMVVVLPPCDDSDIVETWGRSAGAEVLAPPPRLELVALGDPVPPPLTGDTLLVVPRLEAWFLRHRRGLRAVRSLLASIETARRPVVIGCNSWAWAFLAKAVGADLLLPDPVTFRPFDQMRLHGWFAELAAAAGTRSVRFRLPGTGVNVLEQDQDGKPKTDYLQTLAGRSRGIPWVAWHLWRLSLHSGERESVAAEAVAVASDRDPGEQTLWVAALEEYVLPGAKGQDALLVLHALLIHGPLTTDELRLVLPVVGETNVVPVLVKAGFLERREDRFACRAEAYPAIREGLAAAGLPLGKL